MATMTSIHLAGFSFQAWVALAAAALAACAAELAVRALRAKRSGIRNRASQALRDRFVAWRNNPAFGRTDIQHNAQGFRRSTGVAIRKPPQTTRIFFLGGSAAYGAPGAFPHIDSSYSRIYNHQLIDACLEKMLNAEFPSVRTEVINAAASGYRIHQQLALIQSRIRRYRPDHVILMDGYNDVIQLYNIARDLPHAEFDVYENTPGQEEFDALANPGSVRSLFVFANAWLRARSALCRVAQDRVSGMVRDPWQRRKPAVRGERPETVQLGDLTGEERLVAAAALEHLGYYAQTARQIHRVLDLDGIRPVFLLQPILILSRKRLTPAEQKLVEYEWSMGGPLYFYLFREVYREIDRTMNEAARKDGLIFVNLTDVFDSTLEQTFSDFAHLTPAGNRVIAEKLYRDLRQATRGS